MSAIDYQLAYTNYIQSHKKFSNTLYQAYIKKMEQQSEDLGIVRGLNAGFQKVHVNTIIEKMGDLIQSKLDNTFLNAKQAFESTCFASEDGGKTSSFSEKKISKGITDFEQLHKKMHDIQENLMTMYNAFQYKGIKTQADKIARSLKKLPHSGNVIKGQTVDFTKIIEDMVSGLSKQWDLYFEEYCVALLGIYAARGGERLYLKKIQDECKSEGGKNTPSLRTTIKTPTGKIATSNKLADATYKWEGDNDISLSVDLQKVASRIGLARISIKSHRSDSDWIQGIGRQLGAVISFASDDKTTRWALERAFTYREQYAKATNLTDNNRALTAFLRHFLFDSIFGSGKDYVTDFIINDNFYSAYYIAKKMFGGINSSKAGERVSVETSGRPVTFKEYIRSQHTDAPISAKRVSIVMDYQKKFDLNSVWLTERYTKIIDTVTVITKWNLNILNNLREFI